jgi:hypothetical protein
MKPQDSDGSRERTGPADVSPSARYEPDLTGQPDWLPQINREPGVRAFQPHDRGLNGGVLVGGVLFLWLANPIGNGQAKRE